MSTHAYSSDHAERVRITLVIGAISILASWLLHILLNLLPCEIPWWIDTPSVLGFFALFRSVFDKHIWRNVLIRKILRVQVPDLNGVWNGQLTSSHTNHSTSLDAEMVISQTWTNIMMSLETSTSISLSRTAAFIRERPGKDSIVYEYLCEPLPDAKKTMHTHRGTGELSISLDGNGLNGEYYTGRDRQTFGSLNLRRVS